MSHLKQLDTLNLSNNLIKKVENLAGLTVLKTLQISHNFFRSAEDLQGLLDCPSIT